MSGGTKKTNTRFARTSKELADENTKKKVKKKVKLEIKIHNIKKKKKSVKTQQEQKSKPKLDELSRKYGLTSEDMQSVNERIDQSKRMIIIFGVSFFMILIVVFWFVNVKYSISQTRITDNDKNIFDIWSSVDNDLQESLDKIQSDMEVIDGLKEKLSISIASTTASTSMKILPALSDDFTNSTTSSIIKQEEIELLIEKIENLEN